MNIFNKTKIWKDLAIWLILQCIFLTYTKNKKSIIFPVLGQGWCPLCLCFCFPKGFNLKLSFHFFGLSGYFLKDFYLFIFRERGKEGEREGVKHQRVVASHTPPSGGPGLQPRHAPRLGIQPVTLWFAGGYSIHWAAAAKPLWVLSRDLCKLVVGYPYSKYKWLILFYGNSELFLTFSCFINYNVCFDHLLDKVKFWLNIL